MLQTLWGALAGALWLGRSGIFFFISQKNLDCYDPRNLRDAIFWSRRLWGEPSLCHNGAESLGGKGAIRKSFSPTRAFPASQSISQTVPARATPLARTPFSQNFPSQINRLVFRPSSLASFAVIFRQQRAYRPDFEFDRFRPSLVEFDRFLHDPGRNRARP